ncbi:MAG: bifunctional proline dehydrogenase/L-glutamate gamma-semialdehyde dehydrogenase [Bowdeniella nasicola]|nr:bifunctional proline dehydrogenase/L-glutamate gamma-semialdehyde dehydrogenase [Bowdeniella nasicola]
MTQVPADVLALVDDAVDLAHRWIDETEAGQTDDERATTGQLAALVADSAGLDLAMRFVDRVARPEDSKTAAKELAQLTTGDAASFLGTMDRALLGLGAKAARLAPGVVVPLARKRLRQIVGHLVVDSRDPQLAEHLERSRKDGFRLNINLLGEAVLGEGEAASRMQRTIDLINREDVDYVSIKVSSLVSQITTWDTSGTADRVLERLRPLYRAAVSTSPHTFVNLDMEEYRDLDLTIEVFTRLLDEEEFHNLEAGIVLQAYLPDSFGALEQLLDFAARRHEDGKAPIKIRIVKGANLSMERVEAELHGWRQAPYPTKDDVDANYLRLMERILRKVNLGAVRVGVASHNLYAVALAHLLASERGVSEMLDIEMLQGMSPSQARAVRDRVGSVLLYTPVVAPEDFDVAVSYLVRRLEENAQTQNFLRALFADEHDESGAGLADQEDRFRRAVSAMTSVPAGARRTVERDPIGESFENTADSDPALPATRAWAREALAADVGECWSPMLTSKDEVDAVVDKVLGAVPAWQARPAAERAEILRAVAQQLEDRRGQFLTVAAKEAGKTVDQADPEISEAIDFARYYADRALELEKGASLATDGARFEPVELTLVTPPWNFPVAIPCGGVMAALAAGSGVIIKPAHHVPRCTEIIVEAAHAAGVPGELLQAVRTAENEIGRHLVSHDRIDQVILTGASETAEMFEGWRAEHEGGPRVFAETSGKNALIITPAADYDLAVADLVKSAFGHAGQKCSAASLAILVGSAGTSKRLLGQLVDAASSVRVGWPTDLQAIMGPVIEAPSGKLERALTTLEEGESWLVEPRQLDDTGRLWSPGVKDGVSPHSFFHLTECFGPVLGIMRAKTLAEAIELQNAVEYGLTGGLHSLDEEEIDYWLEHVHVGNAYVNRHITGAIVQRQAFGGWKLSAFGPGAKAGGPNYVAQLGRWVPDGEPSHGIELPEEVAQVHADLTGLVTDQAERSWLRSAVASDAAAWAAELGQEEDKSGLHCEANIFRYRPHDVTIRAGAGASVGELARLLCAAHLVGAQVRVSLEPELSRNLKARHSAGPAAIAGLQRLAKVVEVGERLDQFIARAKAGETFERIRVIGESEGAELETALAGTAELTVLAGPVLATGRRELLTFLREQAISRTRHRFGHLPAGEEVPVR